MASVPLPEKSQLRKRILCVDDDPAVLTTRQRVLESAGYSVVTAESGTQALQVIAIGPECHVALVDYLMPEMNGEQLALKLTENRPDIPIIAVSAVEQLPPSFLKLLHSYVQKGSDPETLLAAIARALNRPRQQGRSSSQNTILCVEDEEAQLTMRRMVLETAGFRVLQSDSGSGALELLRSESVDVVVMDYWLLATSGVEIAAEMKRLKPTIPIIMLSGFSRPANATDSVVDVWLRKATVEPEALIDEVRRLLKLNAL